MCGALHRHARPLKRDLFVARASARDRGSSRYTARAPKHTTDRTLSLSLSLSNQRPRLCFPPGPVFNPVTVREKRPSRRDTRCRMSEDHLGERTTIPDPTRLPVFHTRGFGTLFRIGAAEGFSRWSRRGLDWTLERRGGRPACARTWRCPCGRAWCSVVAAVRIPPEPRPRPQRAPTPERTA